MSTAVSSATQSYAPEVVADASGEFCGNGMRFPTFDEAERYAADLKARWLLVTKTRVVPSADQPNYSYTRTHQLALVPVSPGDVPPGLQVRVRDCPEWLTIVERLPNGALSAIQAGGAKVSLSILPNASLSFTQNQA